MIYLQPGNYSNKLMENSDECDNHLLGLIDDHATSDVSFDIDHPLETKRLDFDSELSDDSSTAGFPLDKGIKMENTSDDEATSEIMQDPDSDEMEYPSVKETDGSTPPGAPNSGDDDSNEMVLIHHFNIRDPLIVLRKALETSHDISLEGFSFYLLETELEDHKDLVEQSVAVEGSGTVQINLQLKIEDDGTKKINILDVLKPSEKFLEATGCQAFSHERSEGTTTQPPSLEEPPSENYETRWVMDQKFQLDQQRFKIPQDPLEWNYDNVQHWLLWAVRHFHLTGIKLTDWKMNGPMLCNLTLEDFKTKVPYDPGDTFWTHLELLRRCKFVAVKFTPDQKPKETLEEKLCSNEKELDKNIMRTKEKKVIKRTMTDMVESVPPIPGYRSGNNGQIQLWQFLLELLTDKNQRSCIQWLGEEGEFKLVEPETVALLWGQRKNKPTMNYEKLSRALRYYYEGDLIAKVSGKRFVYKFIIDLKQLIGYSAYDLNRLVIEAELRSLNNEENDTLQHSIFRNGHQF